MSDKRFFKSSARTATAYAPPGHAGTLNRRLIGPESGAHHIELIVGEMESGGHAELHTHCEFEQTMFMLEGRLKIIGKDGQVETLEPGDSIFFPIGVEHKVISETPKSRFLLIYTPPRQASKEKV